MDPRERRTHNITDAMVASTQLNMVNLGGDYLSAKARSRNIFRSTIGHAISYFTGQATPDEITADSRAQYETFRNSFIRQRARQLANQDMAAGTITDDVQYREALATHVSELLVQENGRLTQAEIDRNPGGRLQRAWRNINRWAYRHPRVRAAAGITLNAGLMVASVAGLAPLTGVGGALVFGARVATGAAGIDGLIHTAQDIYTGRRGDRSTPQNMAALNGNEIARRLASFHEDRVLKGQRTASVLENNLTVAYRQRLHDQVLLALDARNVTRHGPGITAKTSRPSYLADTLFSSALTGEPSNSLKERSLARARGHRLGRGVTSLGLAYAATNATTMLVQEYNFVNTDRAFGNASSNYGWWQGNGIAREVFGNANFDPFNPAHINHFNAQWSLDPNYYRPLAEAGVNFSTPNSVGFVGPDLIGHSGHFYHPTDMASWLNSARVVNVPGFGWTNFANPQIHGLQGIIPNIW